MSKVWFITGTSRGFGRFWTEAALKRGDKVAATARSVDGLQDLVKTYGDAVLPIALDVTDHDASFAAVKEAHKKFGRLDVVINNAGYGLFGAIEEASEKLVREQMETNFFGALWVTQAALPFMREQKSGHILQVSSIGGVAAFPLLGFITRRSGHWKPSVIHFRKRLHLSVFMSPSLNQVHTIQTGAVVLLPGRKRTQLIAKPAK